ncbi:siderophore-interacting protein [Kineosporia mesophila]|uniref:Siderophore-interacting protein n=1 Tax=Kineosporia mesophila TaxID=566012 RepID=A0ABP7AMY7_9ACTN|nr:siderophore-interacting protein [Kineosporia mesophila]MCD5349380.1 siderophore-interacting protein [Kineosporia mesophila]
MIPKVRLPAERRMITLEVRSVQPLSDSFVTLTLGGPELKHLHVAGDDQGVRLFFPRPGQPDLRMPTRNSEAWIAELLLWPKASRPWVRNMTVRRVRPEQDEIDIEIAVHGDTPTSTWLRAAQKGSPAGIFDIGLTYQPPPDGCRQLLVGDESALPAIAAILERAPQALTGDAILEVPTTGDVREHLVAPAGVNVQWVVRDDPSLPPGNVTPGTLALEAVRSANLPAGPCTAWVAGEAKLATGVRRHLVNDRGVPRRDIHFMGYWRVGRSAPG